MPTDEEIALIERRRAWWLRVARRGMNQTGVAKALGLSEKSGSTIGGLVTGPWGIAGIGLLVLLGATAMFSLAARASTT